MKDIRSFEDQTIVARQKSKERDYWLNKLAGEIVKSRFPYDHKQAFVEETKKGNITFQFPRDVAARLVKISSEFDPNLYMILTAGVILLLQKYTGNQDILIGTPVLKQQIEKDFVNTILVLRNRVNRKIPFREFLSQVRKTVVEAAEHQNYPIETLTYKLGLDFNRRDFPLFDVAVLLKPIHDKKYLHPIEPTILFSFERNDQSVSVEVEYNTLLYEKSTIQRITNHLHNLLRTVIFDSAALAADIDILSPEEKEQLLVSFNDNNTSFPGDKTLFHFLEQQAEVNPSGTTITYNDEHLTFGELNRRVNRLAGLLREKGVHRGKFAGILLKRSPLMAITILATWKAGGAYIPIDTEAPLERVRYMLDDGQTAVLLTEFGNLDNFFFTELQGLHLQAKEILRTLPRPQNKDFDALPIPDRSLINYEKYDRYLGQAMVRNSIAMQTTRGCPFKCIYCHKVWPKTHVFRSAENIFQELLLYYNMGVRRFAIVDDIFNFNKENSARFFELIIENGLQVNLFYPNGLRADILTRDYIDLMVKAGTVNIGLALETASPRLQKLLRKNLNLDKLKENIDYLCTQYPHVLLELFVMHGLPTETEEEAMTTLNFVKNLKWIDFPYIEILKIYRNTDVEKLALECGISPEAIARSEKLAFHEIPETLPYDKNFTLKFQSEYLNEYFLSKERLLHVLPYQMKVLTEEEIIAKYDIYLPTEIHSIQDLLELAGIKPEELNADTCLQPESVFTPNLHEKMKRHFPVKTPDDNALRVLLLDLSQKFSKDRNRIDLMVEPPLGLMYLLTYINQQFGNKINGKIAKSMIDFDNYEEFKQLLTEFKPEVIGIRTFTFTKEFFHKSVSLIRQWGFDGTIITGGPYATSAYDGVLQDKNIDLAVLGEGEITFAEVIKKIMENDKRLPNDETLKEIQGIAFIPRTGKTGKTYAREVLLLDQWDMMSAAEPEKNLAPVNTSTDIAYAIYTSGSTGNPKGAMVEHIGMMNHIHAKINDIGLAPGSMIAQNASHCFDISVWQFFTPLVLGGKTVIYPDDCILEPAQFLAQLIRHQVNILEVVPSYLSVLLSILDMEFKPMPNLEYLLVTGEPLKPALARRWFEKYPTVKMVNAYGPTEAADDITHYIMEQAPSTNQMAIGKSLQNMNIYIVDEHMKLCPPGVKGEIVVSGIGVGRGYLNDPEKTHQAFTSDPFARGNGKSPRLYRTGDLGCWRSDGVIDFFGRKDYQVKIRGYRIELEEIEKKLVTYKGIKEAVVIEKEKNGNEFNAEPEKFLCAFITADETLELSKVKTYLEEMLPAYMVPEYIDQIEQIPLTPNGKVNRKALARLEVSVQDEELAAAGNVIQEKLVEIWAEVLAVDKNTIGIDSNFFLLGGHSIRAILLAAKVHKEFNTTIQLKHIFEQPTIRTFAKLLNESVKEEFISIEPVEKKEYYPLSAAQTRLFFIQQMNQETIAYNLPMVYKYKGLLEKDRFQAAIKKLIARHESLRTSFEIVGEEPVQKIHHQVEFEIHYYEGNSLPVEDIFRDFVRPFDLSRAPLLRMALIETDRDKYVLMIDVHHIIVDYGSQPILFKDFFAIYTGQQLPPLALQYKDYAEFQTSENQRERVKKQEEYWLKEFEGEIPKLQFPTDFPRPELLSYNGSQVYFTIEPKLTGKIKKRTQETGTTLFMMLLAVYNILLSKYSGKEDIVVGTPGAGRNHADLQNIIGMFINMLALRNFPARDKTFGKFLEEVKEKSINTYDNENYQYDELVGKLGRQGEISGNPLFDVAIQLINTEDVLTASDDAKFKPYSFEHRRSLFDLYLEAFEADDKINITLTYSTELFKKSTVEKIAKHYVQILEQVVKDADIRLKDIKISHGLSTVKSSLTREESMSFEF
ncbi:MAG: amino acid adenylation domain-containing protein [Candidatus Aminicenantes bacterium]|jgi:amino acid adenylation domain-containing protein